MGCKFVRKELLVTNRNTHALQCNIVLRNQRTQGQERLVPPPLSQYATICPRTFSSSDEGDANGMQGIHPATYLLWQHNRWGLGTRISAGVHWRL